MKKRIHFPLTTAQQRRLLFETWEATGKVTHACRVAHVGRRTFSYWKPRFEEGGYAALEAHAPPTPTRSTRTEAALEAAVVALHQQHPTWGKRRIAQELAKAHGWTSVLSPNTVRRILTTHGLWHPSPPEKKATPTRNPSC